VGLVPRRGYAQYELFYRLNVRMAQEYRASRTFDGPTLIVRGTVADERPPLSHDGMDQRLNIDPRIQPDLGWSRLVSGRITVVDVPSDHVGLLRRPAVDRVAKAIDDALR
jgi:hypothetical protein